MKHKLYYYLVIAIFVLGAVTPAGCHHKNNQQEEQSVYSSKKEINRLKKKPDKRNKNMPQEITTRDISEATTQADESETGDTEYSETQAIKDPETIFFDDTWEYASFSKINSGTSTLYHTKESNPKGITICVNAGHGTSGGSAEETQCHPDGSPKLVSGTTSKGSTTSPAISEGMSFPDGTSEAEATLSLALILKDKLLDAGYDVLMIRETDDEQLDNIARTLIANNNADCHIALHYDSTDSDKGAFFMSVPNVDSYKNMEPVKSMWQEDDRLGDSVIEGLKEENIPIFGDGRMEMDLTQTSYATIPSIELEAGDEESDISEKTQEKIAEGILKGIEIYF